MQLEEAPGVKLWTPDPQYIPELVQRIAQGQTLYAVASSQGCGCGFGSYVRTPTPSEYEQWQAEMQRLLEQVAREQSQFQVCTGWDFEEEVQPRHVTVSEIAQQEFAEEGDWLQVYKQT